MNTSSSGGLINLIISFVYTFFFILNIIFYFVISRKIKKAKTQTERKDKRKHLLIGLLFGWGLLVFTGLVIYGIFYKSAPNPDSYIPTGLTFSQLNGKNYQSLLLFIGILSLVMVISIILWLAKVTIGILKESDENKRKEIWKDFGGTLLHIFGIPMIMVVGYAIILTIIGYGTQSSKWDPIQLLTRLLAPIFSPLMVAIFSLQSVNAVGQEIGKNLSGATVATSQALEVLKIHNLVKFI